MPKAECINQKCKTPDRRRFALYADNLTELRVLELIHYLNSKGKGVIEGEFHGCSYFRIYDDNDNFLGSDEYSRGGYEKFLPDGYDSHEK
jgi:hypothetical protein